MAIAQDISPPTVRMDRRHRARIAHIWLALLLGLVCMGSLATGASSVSLWSVLAKLVSGQPLDMLERTVLWDIRAPRTILGLLVGAGLAVSGTVMQGLFRNPLAEPGIIGVSAGAALGAISAIVLGGLLPLWLQDAVGNHLVPLAAFIGALVTMLVLYRVATRNGQTSVVTLLLAGIAIGALSGAVSGLLIYRANDQQLRDLTFWSMGSLAGASWAKVATAGALILIAGGAAAMLGRGLNGLALGEATAAHLGFRVQWLKNAGIFTVAAATGAAVAVSGVIGFVGIVVPHLLRLSTGPDHEPLLINAALLGASLLLMADMISRVVIAPAELPIGIVTALLGAPVFLWILLRGRKGMGL